MDLKLEQPPEKKSLREHLEKFLLSGDETNRCEDGKVIVKKEPSHLWFSKDLQRSSFEAGIPVSQCTVPSFSDIRLKTEPLDADCSEDAVVGEKKAMQIKTEPIDRDWAENIAFGELKGQDVHIEVEPQNLGSTFDASLIKVEKAENVSFPLDSKPESSWNENEARSTVVIKQEPGLTHVREEESITGQGADATGSGSISVKLEPATREVDRLDSPAKHVTLNCEPEPLVTCTVSENIVKQEPSADEIRSSEDGSSENKTGLKTDEKTADEPSADEIRTSEDGSSENKTALKTGERTADERSADEIRSSEDGSSENKTASKTDEKTADDYDGSSRTERKAKKKARLNLREDEDDHDADDSIEPTKKRRRFYDPRSNGGRALAIWGYQPNLSELHTYNGVKLKPCFVKMFAIPNEVLVKHGIEPDVKQETPSQTVKKQVDVQALKKWFFSCNHCDYRSNQLREFRLHERKHTDGTESFGCSECDYLGRSNGSLYVHRMTVHRKGGEAQCTYCDFRTAFPFKLKVHLNSHVDSRYKCDYCDYAAKTSSSLRDHTHKHTGEKPYACYHCSYRASQLTHLRTHIDIHFDVRPFKCSLCHHRTRQKSHLRQHMRLAHSDERPFKCDFCDYATKMKRNLEIHVRCRHTLEEPYCCNQCPFKTAHSSVLGLHVKGHLQKYKFPCQHCSWSTDSSRARRNHIFKSHPDKVITLKCTKCDFRALDRKLLETHKRTENH